MTTNRVSFLLLTALILAAFYPARLSAQDRSLDPSFGRDGRVFTDFFEARDIPRTVLTQADGKLVAAGFATQGFSYGPTIFALARYNEDGSLDTSFGTEGRVTTYVDPDNDYREDEILDLAQQPDGKLIAAGTAMARYNEDGSIDTSFGADGIVLASARAVALQTDGKIVAAGTTLRRYLSDGSLDPTFENGTVVNANGLVVQPDGKIVTAGSALRRFDPNGTPDPTFGTDGVVARSASALALRPDGRLVALSGSILLRQFNPDGSRDLTFGSGGVASGSFGALSSLARSLALQPDGKVVVVGSAVVTATTQRTNFALARFTADGRPDSSFGDDGRVVTDVTGGFDRDNDAYALTVQQDGNIVAVGTVFTIIPLQDWDFVLVRYLSSTEPEEPDVTPPVCGPIAFVADSGLGGPAIVSSATDDVGIASVTFTRLTNQLWGFVGEGDDPDGPYLQGDVVTLGSPAPTSVSLRAVFVEPSGRFSFLVTVADASGNEALCDPVVSDLDGAVPEVTALRPPYPNPVPNTHATTVRLPFALAQPASVRLTMYDVLGREVSVVVDEPMDAGSYESDLDVSDLPSGMYLVRLTTDKGTAQTRWLTVVR